MLIATGTALVLLTWAACILVMAALGLAPALLAGGGSLDWRTLRSSLWWGLLIAALFAYAANLAWPLHGPATAVAGMVLLVVMTVVGLLLTRRRGIRLERVRRPGMAWMWGALGLGVVYLAVAALGPVTNFDSGLYHLGAIRYAAEFSTIPGLANVYFPFGYGNAEFPLAALLGNGPWAGEGFRLLNGLVMAMAALDLVVRSRERRLTPGFYVLAAGVAAAWVPLIALSDYWVTSPTQDSAVLVVTVVAAATLADAVVGGRQWVLAGSTTLALGILLVLLRPTMVVFAAAVVVVLAARAIQQRRAGAGSRWGMALGVVALFAVVAGLTAVARDYLLSGWLQYPLSLFAFDVPWAAADPTPVREATLGFARNPDDMWGSVTGWAWVGPWVGRLPHQWETFLIGAMGLAALAVVLVARRSARGLRGRALVLAMTPSLMAVAVWFVASPPSFRFAWGPLFTVLALPLGWGLWRLSLGGRQDGSRTSPWTRLTVLGLAIPVIAVTCFSAMARLDLQAIDAHREWVLGIRIPYAVADVPEAPVNSAQLASGLRVLTPVQGDQCWATFPLCTPQVAESVRLRGDTLQEGFLP